MPGPGGKSVGRVSIRVVPDSTRFKADLKKSLERIEKSTVLNIPLAIETRNAELALKRFQKKWNGEQVKFNADVKTLGATTHLRMFLRERILPVAVRLTKTSLAKASTILASLSGARLANDLVKSLSESLQNLDRSLPQLAKIGLLVANIGSAALASVGGLVTVGAGLAQIGGISLALPGILAGAGIAVGVLAVALSDAKKKLSTLTPVWKSLKETISDNFWAKAQKPIIDLVQGILPQLRSGVTVTSKALGSWSASVSKAFQNAFGGGVLEGMFKNLAKSIDIASTGTGGFAGSIAILGTVGSSYLPRLAKWVADISDRFNAWLSGAAADGRLTGFIETGITALKQLGTILHNAGSILAGFFHAAEAAGGGLATLGSVLGNVADIINSPAFQTTLTTLFKGASEGMSGLASALGPIGGMLGTLAGTLATILASSGGVVGDILGKIASALSQPAFEKGLGDFFSGIQSGLEAIAPSLPAIADALGSLGSFAGALAAQLGPVLGAVLGALAPILTDVLTAVQPLLPILGGALVQVFQQLGPLVGQIITQLLPPLVGLFVALVPVVLQLVQAILPIVMQLLPPLVGLFNALLPAIMPLVQAVLPLLVAILQPVISVLAALIPVIAPIIAILAQLLIPAIQLLTGVFRLLGPGIQFTMTIVGALANILSTVVMGSIKMITQLLHGDFAGAAKTVGDVFGAIGGIVSGAFKSVGKIVSGVINSIIDLVNGAIGGINDMAAGIKKITFGAVDIHLGKLPHVPSLAMGATVLPTPGGTLTRLAEAGRPETVVDSGLMNKIMKRALGTNSSSGITNNWTLNEVTNTTGTAQAIMRRQHALGAV